MFIIYNLGNLKQNETIFAQWSLYFLRKFTVCADKLMLSIIWNESILGNVFTVIKFNTSKSSKTAKAQVLVLVYLRSKTSKNRPSRDWMRWFSSKLQQNTANSSASDRDAHNAPNPDQFSSIQPRASRAALCTDKHLFFQ